MTHTHMMEGLGQTLDLAIKIDATLSIQTPRTLLYKAMPLTNPLNPVSDHSTTYPNNLHNPQLHLSWFCTVCMAQMFAHSFWPP